MIIIQTPKIPIGNNRVVAVFVTIIIIGIVAVVIQRYNKSKAVVK